MINVNIIGGVQAGKTTLLNVLKKAANKAGYAVSFVDGQNRQEADKGNVHVHFVVETSDTILQPKQLSVNAEPTISASPSELRAAFLHWELDMRAGQCLDPAEVRNVPPGQAAERASESFLRYLAVAQAVKASQ